MTEFLMPSLGADMEEATLVKWRIQVGDPIKRGQVIGEVDTAKGVIDLECFQEGIVAKLVAEEGQTIPVGGVMLLFEGADVLSPHEAAETAPKTDLTPAPTATVESVTQPDNRTSPGRLKISPLARRRAEELGIDLKTLSPSKSDDVVGVADVELAASKKHEVPASKDPEKSRHALRTAIAAAMSKSKREIPHYYLQTTIDMSRAVTWLEQENAKSSIADRLLPAVVLIKAVSRALVQVPQLNGFWQDGQLKVCNEVHTGFAIAMTDGGLIAPAIHHVETKTLKDLMSDLRELIPRARTGRLRSSELTDATITITSLGDLGVETVMGIIYPPQVALIGFGKIVSRPWVEAGKLCVKPLMVATLSADHRATDGLSGAKFLDALSNLLQEPQSL